MNCAIVKLLFCVFKFSSASFIPLKKGFSADVLINPILGAVSRESIIALKFIFMCISKCFLKEASDAAETERLEVCEERECEKKQ